MQDMLMLSMDGLLIPGNFIKVFSVFHIGDTLTLEYLSFKSHIVGSVKLIFSGSILNT